ncbi:MAG: cell division protein FtsL [Pseudomonadota bacterium]|nr:cell division protein FtsL [Pseudomonadota bacterium]
MSRRWMLVLMPVLWLAVLASAIAVVRARHEARTLFVQLEQLSASRDDLNIQWGRLQIEQSTLSNHGRVERAAAEQARMVMPRPDEIRVIGP